MRKATCAAMVGAALVLGMGTASAQDLFDLQKVADGVYAALAKPRTPINCNAAVIVYDEGVLVVDTHSRPSSARALIQQIKGVTDKPVRYAVNSHFHWDHAQGNHAYPVAFPKQVAIVASEATRENLKNLGMQRVKDQIDNGPRLIEDVKRRLAAAQDAAAQAALKEELRQQEEYLAEVRSLELTLPDLTFDKSLILHRPDRDVVLLFLGRGHTSGDVVAYLPKQRVVATGDLLHGWMPFMGDSYPPEWVATLDALDKLDFDHIIGGHGSVKPKAHLRFFRNYLADLIAEVRRARDRGDSLEQASKSVGGRAGPKVRGRHGRTLRSVGRREHREGLQGPGSQALLTALGCTGAGRRPIVLCRVLFLRAGVERLLLLLLWIARIVFLLQALAFGAAAGATFAAVGGAAPAWLRGAMAKGLLISGHLPGGRPAPGGSPPLARAVDRRPEWSRRGPGRSSSGCHCWSCRPWRRWLGLDCRPSGDGSRLSCPPSGSGTAWRGRTRTGGSSFSRSWSR